jgi:hypothetical protein
MQRDAETKGGSLESGCTKKESFHSTSVDSLGMGVKGDPTTGKQFPTGNPSKKAPRGHTLK